MTPFFGTFNAASGRGFGSRFSAAGSAPALYAFTSFTFSPGTTTGRNGPTLSSLLSYYNTSTYPWLNNTSYFNMITQGYQLWTVPTTGNYQITVAGSRGGQVSGQSYTSGNGATLRATVSLTSGDKLEIICGQYEDSSNTGAVGNYYGLGGGGGTFVNNSTTSTLLLAAGGGGGAAYYCCGGGTPGYSGDDATTSTSATGTNTYSGYGGTSGNGGPVNTSVSNSYRGGAGGGWLSSGNNGNNTTTKPFSQTSYYGEGGYGYSAGFIGGDYNYAWGNPTAYASTRGGFGGGGGGNGIIDGGAGGGYSGGGINGAGDNNYTTGTGGGGSYVISSATNLTTCNGLYNGSSTFNGISIGNFGAFNTGLGYVVITAQ